MRASPQQVILELIHHAPNGEWLGKTKLFKAFYFAHLYYAMYEPGILTDHPIAHMPQGPGIDKSDELFGGLAESGFLEIQRDHEGPFPEYRYILKKLPESDLTDAAKRSIRAAAEYTLPKTGAELSQITHDRSRSYRNATSGQILDIYIDLIPDDEFESQQHRMAETEDQWKRVFVNEDVA